MDMEAHPDAETFKTDTKSCDIGIQNLETLNPKPEARATSPGSWRVLCCNLLEQGGDPRSNGELIALTLFLHERLF